MSTSSQPALPEESVCYCVNPHCSSRKNPEESNKCHACGTSLLICDRYRPDGQLMLIDWGTARELTPTYLDKLELSGINPVISKGYTAPEQERGEAIPKSDFFALGRTLVHLLTGKHPIVFDSGEGEGKMLKSWRYDCQSIDNWFADFIEDLINPLSRRRPQNAQVILQRLEERERDRNSLIFMASPMFVSLPRVRQNLIRRGVAAGAIASLLCLGLPVAAPQIAIATRKEGVKYHSVGQWQTAEFFYKTSLLFNSKSAKTHYSLGSVYEKLNNIDAAEKQYELAIEYGNLAAAYNNRALLYLKEHNYLVATSLLLKALKLSKWDLEKYSILKNLGFALLQQGRYLEAEIYRLEAIKLDPNRPEAHCLLTEVKPALGIVSDRTNLVTKKCKVNDRLFGREASWSTTYFCLYMRNSRRFLCKFPVGSEFLT